MDQKYWTNENVFRLIEEYRTHPVLWDPKNELYKFQQVKLDAWNDIGKNMDLGVIDIKRKMESLLASYRRERLKLSKLEMSGEPHKTSNWFAYSRFNFLTKNKKPGEKSLPPNYFKMKSEIQESDIQEKTIKSDIEFISFDDEEINTNESHDNENSNDIPFNNLECSIFYPHQSFEQTIKPSTSTQSSSKTLLLTAKSQNKKQKRNLESLNNYEITKCHCQHQHQRKRDEFEAYGEYIAEKIRNYDSYNRACVQKAMSDLFFEIDTKKLKKPQESNELEN